MGSTAPGPARPGRGARPTHPARGGAVVLSGPLRRRPRPPEFGREQRAAFGVLVTKLPAAVPCRTHDPDLWFSETPAGLELAKHLCGGCPVRAECLQAALVTLWAAASSYLVT